MKSIVLSVLKDKYLKRKQSEIVYDEEKFRNMYGDFVPSSKDLSYLLDMKKVTDLVDNINEIHKNGNVILLSGNNLKNVGDTAKLLQTELYYWGYCQFRTSTSNILELKYGNARKQEDSVEQKQWERINHSEFLILDLWEDDFEDKKITKIERLIVERFNRKLATIVVVHFPLQDLLKVISTNLYDLLVEEQDVIKLNFTREQIKR